MKIVGKYEILETLGRGAWGKVRRAQHLETKQFYAIKIYCTGMIEKRIRNGMEKLKKYS